MKLLSLLKIFLILSVITISQIDSKIRYRSNKNKQVVMGRPSAGVTVVSATEEAEELPGHSVINVGVRPQPNLFKTPYLETPQIIRMTTPQPVPMMRPVGPQAVPMMRPAGPQAFSVPIVRPSPVGNYFPNPLINRPNGTGRFIPGIPHVNIPSDRNAQFHNILNPHENQLDFLNQNNDLNSYGNINHTLDNFANSLANTQDSQQENQIIQKIISTLKNTPENLAHKLEQKLGSRNINKNLILKIKNLLNNNSNKEVEQSLQKNDIISLEPKKKILRLENSNSNQNNSSSVNKNNSKFLKNLLNWARQSGIQIKKLKITSNLNNENNVIATEKIKKNDNILNVPHKYVISSKNPLLKNICAKIRKINQFQSNLDKICMSVFLLTNEKSNLVTYIDFINSNTNFNSFPFFYKKRELKLLEGSNFSSLITAREEAMISEYKILIENKIFNKKVTRDDYFKARINVMSKNISLKDIKGEILSVMVPFADLFSHNSNGANAKLEINSGNVSLVSTEMIKKDEQVFTYYGRFSNYHYLLYYGFIQQNNPIPIQITLDLKIKNGKSDKKFEEVLLSPEMRINSILKVFRQIVNNFNSKNNKSNKNSDNLINIQNETESLRLLKNGLKTQLMRYKTTLKEDLESLKSININDRNVNNILKVLIEEKKIIIKYFNAALIFYRMLKKAQENKNHQMVLTNKITKIILSKKYLRNYFNLLKNSFNLKIEFNNGDSNDKDNFGLDNEMENEFEQKQNNDEVNDSNNNSNDDDLGDLGDLSQENLKNIMNDDLDFTKDFGLNNFNNENNESNMFNLENKENNSFNNLNNNDNFNTQSGTNKNPMNSFFKGMSDIINTNNEDSPTMKSLDNLTNQLSLPDFERRRRR